VGVDYLFCKYCSGLIHQPVDCIDRRWHRAENACHLQTLLDEIDDIGGLWHVDNSYTYLV